jgi:hypothetical protein
MAAPRRKTPIGPNPVLSRGRDNPDTLGLYQLVLSFGGFHASTATAGKPAIVVLTAARALPVSLVD